MKSLSLLRVAGALGIAGSLVIGMGSLAMAAGNPPPSQLTDVTGVSNAFKMSSATDPGGIPGIGPGVTAPAPEGTLVVTKGQGTNDTATWTYSGNHPKVGALADLFWWNAATPSPTGGTFLGDANITTLGTVSISFPASDITGYPATFEMIACGPTISPPTTQTPEVPWAAGLPLMLAVPFGFYALRRRSQV
jgi:hypothetical protein